MFERCTQLVAVLSLSLIAAAALAQAPVRPPYGPAVSLETAKKIGEAAIAEAKKRSWNVAVAVVDNHGMLIWYQMQDDTQTASAEIALDKARTAAVWRRTSKEFEENVAAGRVALLGIAGITPVEGGVPIVVGGKMIGAVGVSGMTSPQDGEIARAGLDALK